MKRTNTVFCQSGAAGRLSGSHLNGQAFTALGATRVDHSAATTGFHANTETVCAFATGYGRLVSTFHGNSTKNKELIVKYGDCQSSPGKFTKTIAGRAVCRHVQGKTVHAKQCYAACRFCKSPAGCQCDSNALFCSVCYCFTSVFSTD